MPDIKFLEEHPLYTKYPFKVPPSIDRLKRVNINMFCPTCNDIRTFNMTNNYQESKVTANYIDGSLVHPFDSRLNKYIKLEYLCASCKEFMRFFFIMLGENLEYIQKIGQYPPYETNIPKDFKKFLGEYEDYFKKGRLLEFHGYGIGAYTYYRRIIEGQIYDLLDKISNLMKSEEKEVYQEALEKVKKQKIAAKKIEIVKDLLPFILIKDGRNPLNILYEALSIGIHKESDEVCMENAQLLRTTLVYLVETIFRQEIKSKEFAEDLDKIKKKLQK